MIRIILLQGCFCFLGVFFVSYFLIFTFWFFFLKACFLLLFGSLFVFFCLVLVFFCFAQLGPYGDLATLKVHYRTFRADRLSYKKTQHVSN